MGLWDRHSMPSSVGLNTSSKEVSKLMALSESKREKPLEKLVCICIFST